jgi:hypothetical protein
MRVTEITVTSGRTFNHPHESYSNLRPSVTLKASLDDSDDPDAATKALQAKAERLVEDHKTLLLDSLERIWEQDQIDDQITDLERQLTTAQSRLDALRQQRRLFPESVDAIDPPADRTGNPTTRV